MGATTAIVCDFGPALVRGLAELGPFPAPGDDLSLELGLSIWLYESQIEVEEAFGAMAEVRSLIIEEAGLDGRTEPVPLVGRGVESDLVVMASYLDGLLGRAASVCGCSLEALADRVIARQGSDAVVVRGRSVGSVTSGLFRTARG